MADFISILELEQAIIHIYYYLKNNDITYIQDEKVQAAIRLAKEIDCSIKTYREYDSQVDYIPKEHNVTRMAVMLLNTFGELYCEGGSLTIYEDDLWKGKANHTNTYELKLKEPETHLNIFKGNPSAESKPYDFDTEFKSQLTHYQDGNLTNTTRNAWDSFASCYKTPTRTLDFKSALWKKNHEHYVNYIIQIDRQGTLSVFRPKQRDNPKQIKFESQLENRHYLQKYLNVLACIDYLNQSKYDLSWDNFIINKGVYATC